MVNPVLLRFSVKDAEELFLDKGNGQPPVKLPKFKGTLRDAPREPRVYKLIARNGDQTTEQVLNLNVDVLPPQITGFKIGPRQVIRGQGGTILLEWKTRNAQKIEMTDIGDVGASDTAILAAPTDTKTYTLVATNAKGVSTKRSLTVTVIDPPPVVVVPPPPPVAVTPPPPVPPI
ncbi:MAG: hypothetical protein HC933_18520, partial [Pleurocapsa sp. SU_196_0]|nr:hypothetical protein [Pleurocapsa sp. SU_196_0]